MQIWKNPVRRKKLKGGGQEYGGTHSTPHYFFCLFLQIMVSHEEMREMKEKWRNEGSSQTRAMLLRLIRETEYEL